MDRLGAISLFTKVVETGSFSEAGRQTGRSPASVSRQIKELEEWIGGRLFTRTTRKITLTEIGRSYYGRVRHILLDLEEAQVIAAGMQDYPTGNIQITVPASLESHLTVAAANFQARWPGVEFSFSVTDEVVDLVKEGFDMAIRIGRLQDSTLKARKISEAKRVICASPKYLEASGTLERAEHLQNHNCLTFSASPGYNIWQFRRGSKTIDIRAEGRFRTNSGPALVCAARLDMGIILVPEWLVSPFLKSGELVSLLKNDQLSEATTPIYAVHAYERFVPPKVKIFIDYLVERFGGNYDWSLPT